MLLMEFGGWWLCPPSRTWGDTNSRSGTQRDARLRRRFHVVAVCQVQDLVLVYLSLSLLFDVIPFWANFLVNDFWLMLFALP